MFTLCEYTDIISIQDSRKNVKKKCKHHDNKLQWNLKKSKIMVYFMTNTLEKIFKIFLM